jgi:hypothetical protein
MEERKACELLKQRFERAGFRIEENRPFDEDGVQFEMDGFDSDSRVGYEYVTAESGDGWDVDGDVIAALDARKEKGELYVLVVDEDKAPDEASLGREADAFLADLRERGVAPKPAKAKPAAKKPAPKAKPKAKAKPPPIPKKKSKK